VPLFWAAAEAEAGVLSLSFLDLPSSSATVRFSSCLRLSFLDL
jgi:hypothetical protein